VIIPKTARAIENPPAALQLLSARSLGEGNWE